MEEKHPNYLERIKDANSFNNHLVAERRLRLPFIDTQTGVAQADCSLWRSPADRKAARDQGQRRPSPGTLFSYPAPRWRKRRREYLMRGSLPALPAAGQPSAAFGSFAYANQHYPNQRLGPANSNSQSSSLAAMQRSDSTGSHSHSADSDSRDQSVATSQSFDSPSRLVDDEHSASANLAAGHQAESSEHNFERADSASSANYHESACHEQPLPVNGLVYGNTDSQTMDHSYNYAHTQHQPQQHQQHIDDQTKAAIRMHSKMNRKRNIGQSLISKSILVKNGRIGADSAANNVNQPFASEHCDSRDTRQSVIHNNHSNGPISSTLEALGAEFRGAQALISDGARPYVCSICDQTYKTRSGLSYHFIHTHNTILPKNLPNMNKVKRAPKESSASRQRKHKEESILVKANARTSRTSRNEISENDIIESQQIDDSLMSKDSTSTNDSHLTELNESYTTEAEKPTDNSPKSNKTNGESTRKSQLKQNPFCDFCLGTVDKNRRTRLPEELVSCTSCGSSGHPTCLRFSDNIRNSIKRYDWQCIECKTCSNCNTADNEDQLLFCDDCDRSYHTYCLNPPLVELPEGSWSCHLCLIEYHGDFQEEKGADSKPTLPTPTYSAIEQQA